MQKDVKRVPLPIHEEIVEETKKPTMALVRYFERIISLIADRMRWLGVYNQGQTYYKNDVVIDGRWTMIANKETSDRPAPVPDGDPEYIFQGTMSNTDVTAKQVMFGQRYTLEAAGWIDGYRIYVFNGQSYNIYLNRLTTGGIDELIKFTASTTGWVEFSVTPVIAMDTEFDLIAVVTEPDPTPTTWTAEYVYSLPNNVTVPIAGQITHSNKEMGVLSISKTDNLGADRETELLALTIGDKIDGAGGEWVIQSSADNGTYMSFGISPSSQGTAGTYTFSFHTVTATPIQYGIDTNYYQPYPNIQGLFIADGGYEDIAVSENAYGVDLLYQDAVVSEDWELVAYSA